MPLTSLENFDTIQVCFNVRTKIMISSCKDEIVLSNAEYLMVQSIKEILDYRIYNQTLDNFDTKISEMLRLMRAHISNEMRRILFFQKECIKNANAVSY